MFPKRHPQTNSAPARSLPDRSSPITLSQLKEPKKRRLKLIFPGSLDSFSVFREEQMKLRCCVRDATCSNVMGTWAPMPTFPLIFFFFFLLGDISQCLPSHSSTTGGRWNTCVCVQRQNVAGFLCFCFFLNYHYFEDFNHYKTGSLKLSSTSSGK